MAPDFEAEGLLDGLAGEEDRAARMELLEQLHADGVGLDELRRAVAEDRLALLPVVRVLGPEARYTTAEAAARAGVDGEFLLGFRRALGLPVPDPGEVAFNDEDVEAARTMQLARESGLPDEGLLEITHLLGNGMARYAEALRDLFGQTYLKAGDTERDLGLRYARAAVDLMPLAGPTFEYVFRVQIREVVRRDVLGRTQRATGRLVGATDRTVAFADLVGFTRLGERVPSDELGHVANRLTRMAVEVAQPPVRLVKSLGDAVMLVSPDTEPLLDAILELVERSEADTTLPALRAGLARGPVINRWGDWYGAAVNLASRITDRARPGRVLAAEEVRADVAADAYRWSPAGAHRLKGFKRPQRLLRVRRTGT